jgi:aminoglycoside/choline kinase family phosphotransferase
VKSSNELIAFARKTLGLAPGTEAELIPFSGRGSDRAYFRFRWEAANSVIIANYQPGRIENTYYANIALFLKEIDIPVPHIIDHDKIECLIIQEDLGGMDLWALRDAPWETRKDLYRKTLTVVHKLHSYPTKNFPSDRVSLMEAFGPNLYHWERDYFKTNFIGTLCKIELEPKLQQDLEHELAGLAGRLSRDHQSLVHRDLQSQNVMIKGEMPFLIDFQGMRFGSRFYDLGSLLCDPYVSFSDRERHELLSFCFGLETEELNWDSFQEMFWEASAQRLMQALGAYGFLGMTRGLPEYLQHVPAGLRNLTLAAENARSLPVLLETCRRCEKMQPIHR